jgi:hypothetical protein
MNQNIFRNVGTQGQSSMQAIGADPSLFLNVYLEIYAKLLHQRFQTITHPDQAEFQLVRALASLAWQSAIEAYSKIQDTGVQQSQTRAS